MLKTTGKRVDDTQQRPIYYKSINVQDNSIISFSKSYYNDNYEEDEFGNYAQPIFRFNYKDNGELDELFGSTIPIYRDQYPSKLRISEILESNGAGLEAELNWVENTYYHNGNAIIPNTPILAPTPPIPYPRNYEERIGYDNFEPTTVQRYEDYFIEKQSNIETVVNNFINQLNNLPSNNNFINDATTLINNWATQLWQQAVASVQANNNANPDDRPLYWARIKMQVALKSHSYFNGGTVNQAELNQLIKLFEEKSRNYTGVDFSTAPVGVKKILITGFDPFSLGSNIRQSNPSGCVALALHGTSTPNGLAYIQTMLFPVRYADFDSSTVTTFGQGLGVVEDYISTDIFNEVDAIITISQSLPNQNHIDVFATARRGGGGDNLEFTRVTNSKSIGELGEETYVTTLPDTFAEAPSEAIFYGKYFNTITEYNNSFRDLNLSLYNSTKLNYPTSEIFMGPGGNYLSNEIFYRVSRLREMWIEAQLPTVATIATGHFHIEKIQSEGENLDISKMQTLLNLVITTINKGVTGL